MMIRRILLPLLMLMALLPLAAAMVLALPSEAPVAQVPPPDLLPTDVIQHLQEIQRRGRLFNNRNNVFSKVGDSITVSDNFLHPIGYGIYNLDAYGYLYDVIEHFSQADVRGRNSFNAVSLAAGVGWSAWSAFQIENSDTELCLEDEIPLECEYRLTQPSMAIIMFGTNEVSFMSPAAFSGFMSHIIDLSEDMGVIPIISTLPDRHAHEAGIAVYNEQIRALAASRRIPLLDYAAALHDLPDRGIWRDGVHPSYPADQWFEGAALFTPDYLHYGYVIRNLTALQMLDRVWRSLGSPS